MDFQPYKYHVISIDWITFLLGAVQSFQHFQHFHTTGEGGGEGGSETAYDFKRCIKC